MKIKNIFSEIIPFRMWNEENFRFICFCFAVVAAVAAAAVAAAAAAAAS